MSVEIPKMAVAFGAYAIPQGDVIDCRVHLGCTKEVSSFELLLQNWDKKYSPGGTMPLAVGMDGHIDIGRGSNVPQIITCRIESVKFESTPTENYVRVSGRCWGERLFRRTVTKTYENQKGEAIVKDLIDYYVGLSHVRDTTELIENTDTTYTKLEYENTPVFDILKYIAESADKAGVIGYDFRVAPDGKFEFFPKNSKFWADVGLVLYLPLDEGSGAVAYDKSNKGNNGTLVNGPTWVDGKYGKALSFDGVDDYVEVPNSDSILQGLTSASITFWAWTEAQTTSYRHMVGWRGYNTDFYILQLANSDNLECRIQTAVSYWDLLIPMTYQTWTHLAFVRNGNIAKVFKNGVEVASRSDISGDWGASSNLFLGRNPALSSYFHKGIIDEVRIYNRALSAQEIMDHFLSGPPCLSQKIEVSEYRKDIHRIRNKITVFGTAEKPFPLDKDGQPWSDTLTEDLTVSPGTGWGGSDELVHSVYGKWTVLTGSTNLALDTAVKYAGAKSVKVIESGYMYYTDVAFQFNAGKEINADEFPQVIFAIYIDAYHQQTGSLRAKDINGKYASKRLSFTKQNEWEKIIIPWGSQNAERWDWIDAGFDWTKITAVDIAVDQKYFSSGVWRIDMFHFGYARWKSIQEDTNSQTNYGLRELVEVDEELCSDNSCERRAKALLAHLKDPAEYLSVRSMVIDYGNTPLLPGDKIHVTLPNENVDSDFRIESVEYRVDARTQTLEISLELGKAPPLLADYLYGLRSTTVTVEKLARTKLGRFKIPTMAGAGVGVHARGHEAGDEAGNQWPNLSTGGWDRITGWISPKHIGPYSDTADIIKFRTKNKAGTAVLDHLFIPSDNEYGIFGRETEHWKELHSKFLVLYHGLEAPYGDLRIKAQGEANPKARLTEELLEFGPGGNLAADVYLKRTADNTLELKAQYLLPQIDNILELGSSTGPKRIAKIYASSFLLPTDGFLHIMVYGEANPKARLTQDSLAFGAGGASAADTWLKRLAANDLEVSADILPDSDNARELGLGGASPKRWKNIYAVNITVSNMLFNMHLIPDLDNTYDLGSSLKRWRDLYLAGAIKALAGGVAVHLLPNANATYDLGSGTMKWGNLYVNGVGDLGWLNVAGFTVITSARVLQNVAAAAGIITSGRFPLARLPEGTAGYVLEAEGAGFDPMYVNPNGRYTPASHSHAAGDITSGVLAEARIPTVFANARTFNGGITMGAALNMNSQAIQNLASLNQAMPPAANSGSVGTTTTYWNCIAGNSVWYKNLGQFDALDDLALIKRIKANGETDEKGVSLADPESLPSEVTENGLINAGHLMGLLIGAIKQLSAKVDSLEKQLEAKRGVAA